jgi:hypothetical protein
MHWAAPIFLAYGDTSAWEIVVWIIAGIVGIIGQWAANKKKKEQQARQKVQPSSSPPPAARSGGGDAPTPAELAEIFKRLGANIPATPPPPPPRPRPAATPAPQMARKPALHIVKKRAAETIQPLLAQRLAKAKQEAEAAGREADAAQIATTAIVQGVQSRAGETRALDTATRHTGAVLPRLYAMSMRMTPLPSIPMPGLDRTHHVNKPLRTALHTRREVRDALIAQSFLQPAKGLAR